MLVGSDSAAQSNCVNANATGARIGFACSSMQMAAATAATERRRQQLRVVGVGSASKEEAAAAALPLPAPVALVAAEHLDNLGSKVKIQS